MEVNRSETSFQDHVPLQYSVTAIKLYQGRTYRLPYLFRVHYQDLERRLCNYDIGKEAIPLRIHRTASVRVLSGITLQNHISFQFVLRLKHFVRHKSIGYICDRH